MNLCNFCKKEIIDIDNSSKFCSHNCKLEHFKKRYPPKKEKKCNFCNNTLDFNFFRIVKIVKKGPKKGKYVGWRTINNDYRASRCLINNFCIRLATCIVAQVRFRSVLGLSDASVWF